MRVYYGDDVKESRILMLDLEMTGLDPARDRIIEVACFVVEGDTLLPVPGAELELAVMPNDPSLLDRMDEWNTRTHNESGLIRRIREKGVSIREAEKEIMNLLNEHMSKGAIICGNSIHWDRIYIRQELPAVDDFCTFRMIDVSSIKELLRRIDSDGPRYYKRSPHTALADAKGSLEELRFYVERYINKDFDQ